MSLPTRLRSQRWDRDEIDYGGDWEPMHDLVQEEEPEEVIPNEGLEPERFEIPEQESHTHDSDLDLGVDRLELESLEEFQMNVQIGEDGGLILEDLNPPTPPLSTLDHIPSDPPSPDESESISLLSDRSSLVHSTRSGKEPELIHNKSIVPDQEFSPIAEDDESLVFQTKTTTSNQDKHYSFDYEEDISSRPQSKTSVIETPARYSNVSLENGHTRNVSTGVLTLESLINDVQSDIVSGGYDNEDKEVVGGDGDDYDYDYDDYEDENDKEDIIRPLSTVQSQQASLVTPKPPTINENELHPVGSSGSLSTGNFSFESSSKTDITGEKEPRRNSTSTFDMGGWKPNTDAFRGTFVNQNFAHKNHDDAISIPATIDVTLPSVSEIPDEEEEYSSTPRLVSSTTLDNSTRVSSGSSTIDKVKSRDLDAPSANTSTISTATATNPPPSFTQKYPKSNWGKIMAIPQRQDRIQELTKALSAGSDYDTGLTDWLSITLKQNDSPEFVNIGNLATKIFQESDKNPRRPSTRTRVLHVKDKVHVASDLGKRFLNRGKKILK